MSLRAAKKFVFKILRKFNLNKYTFKVKWAFYDFPVRKPSFLHTMACNPNRPFPVYDVK